MVLNVEGIMYNSINTDFDTMKEYLIYGAELDGEYGFAKIPPINILPNETIDFDSSLNRNLKGHKNLNVNFYISDIKFQRLFNNCDRYLNHLKCFHSVMMPDFSVSFGLGGMPMALNIYNKWRNHALAWYMYLNDITVIPSVNIIPYKGREWLLDGLPKRSTVCCSTNGRVRSKAAREEFCEGFYEMCEMLQPTRVVVVGMIPQELNSPVDIINLENRATKKNKELGGK